jgi:hypothetical protein
MLIHVTISTAMESVRVEVPIEVVDALFSGQGEELNIRAGFRRAPEAPRRHRARQGQRLHRPHLDRRRELAMLKMVLDRSRGRSRDRRRLGGGDGSGGRGTSGRRATGHHIVVPVPLALAQVAAAFVPLEKTHVRLPPKAVQYMPVAKQILAALAEARTASWCASRSPTRRSPSARKAIS